MVICYFKNTFDLKKQKPQNNRKQTTRTNLLVAVLDQEAITRGFPKFPERTKLRFMGFLKLSAI